MIATASKSTTAKSFLDSCLLCTTPKYANDCRLTPRWPWILCSAVRYLFVTQCCHPILAGRGRGISILIRKEHTISCVFCGVFSFAQIGHVRCIINILTCSEALGSKLELLKVSFVSEFPKKTWTQRKQQQIDRNLSWKPRSHVRILIYRTWHIAFRNIILPLPRYHRSNLERARALLPLPPLFFDTFFFFFWRSFSCSSEVTRSPHGNKMSQINAWSVLWDSTIAIKNWWKKAIRKTKETLD